MKGTYEDYLFVGKFSGTGWDEEAKHFTNPSILVDEFVAVCSDVLSSFPCLI